MFKTVFFYSYMHLASAEGHIEVVEVLLSMGKARIDVTNAVSACNN